MGMPNDFVIIRHGQSEGNVAVKASEEGSNQYYTNEFMTTPGHRWRLTKDGQKQAEIIGSWVQENISKAFDHYYVSPFVRTRETAARLQLPEPSWRLNRALRERDWGDIGSIPHNEFENSEQYKRNAWMKENDSLYWVAPGGESIAQVAEDRVRNVLSTLHREAEGQKVIAVSHGETMSAFRLVLERLNDEDFIRIADDKTQSIKNCMAMHYTRINPETGKQASRLTWVRTAHPVEENGVWVVKESPWREIIFPSFSNEELLNQVENVPYLIKKD